MQYNMIRVITVLWLQLSAVVLTSPVLMVACAEILHMVSSVFVERATQAACVRQVSPSLVRRHLLHVWTMGVHTCQCVCCVRACVCVCVTVAIWVLSIPVVGRQVLFIFY